MALKNSHKAIIITFLLVGSALFVIVNLTLKNKQHNNAIAETFYDLEKEEEEDLPQEVEEEAKSNSKSTNRAFNTTKNYKPFTPAYKTIEPPTDFEPKTKAEQSNSNAKSNEKGEGKSTVAKNELTTSFESVNSILSRRSQNIKSAATNDDTANTNSSIYYSLKNRTDTFLPIPVYLCDETGKITINITVNEEGKVIDAYFNNSSTSKNDCLKQHALEYAKEARFDASKKKKQLGSITFLFK